eukprot:5822014-Ditylum_brightwellii.AAC.1
MKHFVKTKAGITKQSYQHEDDNEKFGEGQGETSSPPNWLFQSSTLLNALHALLMGIQLVSACRNFFAKRVAEAYVDNTDNMYVNQEDQVNAIPT